jgi:ketosteroid isomerase-like protein
MKRTNNSAKAMSIVARIFEAQKRFVQSGAQDWSGISAVFDPSIVVREPASLPYAGDWRGHQSLGLLFRRMDEVWSTVDIENIRATLDGDTLFMCCTLQATARNTGREIQQPVAEVLKINGGFILEGTPYYHDTAAICAALGGEYDSNR